MYIYTSMHDTAKIMDNNVVSDKLKVNKVVSQLDDTFVVYIVHPMCSDEYMYMQKVLPDMLR